MNVRLKRVSLIAGFLLMILGGISSGQSTKRPALEMKRDPFSIEIKRNKDRDRKDSSARQKQEPPEKQKLPTIKLVGAIIHGGRKVAILEIDGREYILSEGDRLTYHNQHIMIKRIEEGSVELTVERKDIRMNF